MYYLFGGYRIRGSHSGGGETPVSVELGIEYFSRAEAIFFFSYTINSSERQDHAARQILPDVRDQTAMSEYTVCARVGKAGQLRWT